ncbi:MAG: GspH/FimT family pseudopilin [Acidobacteria bacterium]|nr:GspH/FimT family pseudopilin [Acidobacteriota bacterium]
MAIGSVAMSIAVPAAKRTVDSMRLVSATRDVERELQVARLKAVSTNRFLRVRFNCPSAGYFRIVEITGVSMTDTASNRCDPDAFPYPGPRDTDVATPANDGPLRILNPSITLGGNDLLFGPSGTTRQYISGSVQPISTSADVTLTRSGSAATISVNGLGKIRIQ